MAKRRARVRDPGALAAFDLLLAFGGEANNLVVAPGVQGTVKEVRFTTIEGKGWPFALVPNRDSLLFQVRPLGARTLKVTRRKLEALLPVVPEGDSGKALRVRVRTEAEARDVIAHILEKWPRPDGPLSDARIGIPPGITRKDVLLAAARVAAGKAGDQFGESVNWDVLVEGRLLDPRRVIAVAARRLAGRELVPEDLTGAEESRCHQILEELRFRIIPKGDWRSVEAALEADAVEEMEKRTDIGPAAKRALINARGGHGIFRKNLEQVEQACRITGVLDRRHLRARHIKPWRVCSDFERLDGFNGLLLSPHVDHLFGQGYVSFSDEGTLLVSRWLNRAVLERWGIAGPNPGKAFSAQQRIYLAWHREHVFEREEAGRRRLRKGD